FVSKKTRSVWGMPSYFGQITIGDFEEGFSIPLGTWNLREYKRQWKEGLERIKSKNTSCIVTNIHNLKTNPYIELWSLYKEGDKIFFHNQLILFEREDLSIALSDFNSKNCYQFVEPRIVSEKGEGINEEGQLLFEKSTNVSDVINFEVK
ncbi:MAG: hypothetical protein ACYC3G_05010, partial [Minisyncoccota bacterium]